MGIYQWVLHMHAYVYNHMCLMCIACTLYAPIAYKMVALASFTHTPIISLIIRLRHFSSNGVVENICWTWRWSAKCSKTCWKCSVKIILNNIPYMFFCNIFKVMCCTCLTLYSTLLRFNVLIWHLYFILMLGCGVAFILHSMQVCPLYYNTDTFNLLPLCNVY